MEHKYDLAVIGGGPGGYVAAIRAAQLGMKVVCIDKRTTLGGTCLNVGCIPSKTLLSSSELYYHVSHEGQALGLRFNKLNFDFTQIMKRKEHVVHSLVEGIAGLLKRYHIPFISGSAQFLNAHHLKVVGDNQQLEIEAKNVIIATGSESTPLRNIPFDNKFVISSTEALSLNQVPERLVVIGGGVIGVELASVYNRLGSKVTIIEMLPQICPAMDTAISKQLLQALKSQGIHFMLSTQVISAVQSNEVVLTVSSDDKLLNIGADKVLVSIGRRPYTKDLGLENVNIAIDKNGFIPVDGSFRTSQPNIFAIGDVIEGTMLAHLASQEGVAAAECIAGVNSSVDYMAIPNVIYTSPEVAAVGLTEQEAFAAGLTIQIGTVYFKGNPRARCTGEVEGMLKILGDKNTGKVIGMHIIGAHASELISDGVIAIQQRLTLQQIADTVFAHPTLSELIKEAALVALSKPMHA
jgi:dihydrolipoamide dehydrogenase